ncbi:DUF397 domain-containing protein [Streptomyces sp. NPDC000345]|uniref:DUF397 domain-containing protein n=1 Tax=Streptomyces sp. NPDC000345 TaxID=3364537 RepID=UPI00369BA79E
MSSDATSASGPVWFKSSHSGGNTTECVEAAFVRAGVLLRDSKAPGRACISVSADTWSLFVSAVLK